MTQAVTAGDVDAVNAALAAGADVNERNNGGQTALILAVIFGHGDLVHLLVKAGANPRLRDNLGLDAIEWAQRRGLTDIVDLFADRVVETRVEKDDEKSRKWLAGVKQRIQEQQAALKEQPVVGEPEPEPEPEPRLQPQATETAEPDPSAPRRKRCPKCGAIYNSELVAYCAHHVVRLVDIDDADADEAIFSTPATSSAQFTNTPLLWIFVLMTISIAVFTGYLITSQLTSIVIPDTQTTGAPPEPRGFLKGSPVASGDLAGKSINLPEAECPVFENESRPADASKTVNVHVKLDKAGKVYWARAEGGDEALRTAATEAAANSTFSPDKLRGREMEGTISYTFAP